MTDNLARKVTGLMRSASCNTLLCANPPSSANIPSSKQDWSSDVNNIRRVNPTGKFTSSHNFDTGLVRVVHELIDHMKTEQREELEKVKAQFEVKVLLVEKKLEESMLLQTNFDSKLSALERRELESREVTANFRGRLSSIEGTIGGSSLSQVCELKANLDHRLSELEALTYQIPKLQEPGPKAEAEQTTGLANRRAIFEDSTAGMNSLETTTKKNMDLQAFGEKESLEDLKLTFEHRFCSAESNIDLIAMILKRVDKKLSDICQQARQCAQSTSIDNAGMSLQDLESMTCNASIPIGKLSCTRNVAASQVDSCVRVGLDTLQIHHESCNCGKERSTCYPIAEEDV